MAAQLGWQEIAATAARAGAGLDPGVGTATPRSVRLVEIAVEALDIAGVRPSCKAALGYADETGATGPTDPLVNPLGQGLAVWFQQMTEPRPQRNPIHLGVSVPHHEAAPAFGPPWPRAVCWSPTSAHPLSGCWPTPRGQRGARDHLAGRGLTGRHSRRRHRGGPRDRAGATARGGGRTGSPRTRGHAGTDTPPLTTGADCDQLKCARGSRRR